MSGLSIAKAEELTHHLKLFANPNRLRIMARLLDSETSVGDLETELGIRQPTLSRELANLRENDAIVARRESKVVFYSIAPGDTEYRLRCVLNRKDDAGATPRPPRSETSPDFDPRPKFRFYPRAKTAPIQAV